MNYCFIIICPEQMEHLADERELQEVYKLFKQFLKKYNKAGHSRKFEILSSVPQTLLIKSETLGSNSLAKESFERDDSRYLQEFISLLKNDLSGTRKVSDYSAKIG